METVDFHHFLERMRNPAAADLVRSIKSFVISFQSSPPDPEKDSRSVQEFMSNMEEKFRVHPLWSGATDEEIESAGEGLEKYLMTKLHNRAFASISEDVEHDEKISEKITLLQTFIKPEHLDIPPNFRNESSWLLAQKELQKINTYKAPRDKLVCILNCCRVINNLLVNVSIASNEHAPGADDFLPVLIYVTIKANPPQLHLNLLYIQRYRHHSRLVSEASYFYTNLVSAESFIEHLDASSISMDKNEFEYAMQEARETMHGAKSYSHAAEQLTSIDTSQSIQAARSEKRETPLPAETTDLASQRHDQVDAQSFARHISAGTLTATPEKQRLKQSVANLEAKGSVAVLDANRTGRLAKEFPFLYANVGDLRVADVESLLLEYKELALRYYSLCKAIEDMPHLETQANPSQKNELHGALNDDNRKSEAASQHETSMNLAESDLEQMKLLPKDLKSASEKELDERDATSLSRDSDILDGMSIHNFTDESQGNDTSQNSIRENMDEVGQNPPAEVTSDKNSHLSDQLIIDTATSRHKSLGEHLLENEAPLIDI